MASITRGCWCPRQETAAPPEPSRIRRPSSAMSHTPSPPTALGGCPRKLRCSTRLCLAAMTFNLNQQHTVTSPRGELRSLRGAAWRRIGRKPDDDDGVAGAECAEIKILGTRSTNELYRIGSKQSKLVIEQFRHAAAASKAGNPDALRRLQALGCPCHAVRRNAGKACRLGFELVGHQHDGGIRTLAPPLGSARERRALRRPARLGQSGAKSVPS